MASTAARFETPNGRVSERDTARSERDAAVSARDVAQMRAGKLAADLLVAAKKARDRAISERNGAISERDAAVSERDTARSERDAAVSARDVAQMRAGKLAADLLVAGSGMIGADLAATPLTVGAGDGVGAERGATPELPRGRERKQHPRAPG